MWLIFYRYEGQTIWMLGNMVEGDYWHDVVPVLRATRTPRKQGGARVELRLIEFTEGYRVYTEDQLRVDLEWRPPEGTG